MDTQIKLPNIGVDKEVEVTDVLVKIGDKIETEQSIIVVEGDKTSIEIPSPYSGIIKKINIKIGDKIKVNDTIMVINLNNNYIDKKNIEYNEKPISINNNIIYSEQENNKDEIITSYSKNIPHATPIVRRLAHEFEIDITQIKGTGRKGRILREDIQNYIESTKKQKKNSVTENYSNFLKEILPWPKIDFESFGEIKKIELGRIQKISGSNLHRNWLMIPHVTQFDHIDITETENFRQQKNIEIKKKEDIKITLLSFVMKVVAQALKIMPKFNSSLSEDCKNLILKKYINIGIAVDTQNGLVVPVLRDVDKKGILELSKELKLISQKARDGKLTNLDIQGGCFTISSLGGIGGYLFTPIINAPEVAIIGISRASIKPVWNGEEFKPKLILPISLSYDHRVIDGAEGARFINLINNLLFDIKNLIM